MGYWNSAYLFFRDTNGQECTLQIATQAQTNSVPGSVDAMANAIADASDCGLVAVQYATTQVNDVVPSVGTYSTVWDRAQFTTRASVSNVCGMLSIPGPKSTIFQAGGLLVDMSNALVVAAIAAYQATAGDKSGNAITRVNQGKRSKVRGDLSF